MSNKQLTKVTFETIPLLDIEYIQDLTDPDNVFSIFGSLPHIPLLVTKPIASETYVIIDGYKRFNSLKNNGIDECLCEIIEFEDLKQTGLLRIKLNSHRISSFKEKYLFLKWLKNCCNTQEYKELAQSINISDKDRHSFEQLISASTVVVDAVFKGCLDISIVSELQYYPEEDLQSIINLFSTLPFSRQTQRELLEWFPELAFRIKKSIHEIVTDPSLEKIYNDQKLNGPQKIQKVRDYCFELRFPTIAKAKKNWNSVASTINPDTSAVSFNASDAFEKNILEIRIKVSDAKKAENLLKKLSGIPVEKWEMLIYPALLYGVTQK